MIKTKVTMRDIAKELNLSVATVSYVLNHSEKEKISHETRLKVLDTAKRMGYIPNLSARSLANRRSNLIGIIINLGKQASRAKKERYYDLAIELQRQLAQKGYDTLVSVTKELRRKDIEIVSRRSLEVVFIIDIEERYLKEVTQNCYVPIVFLECFIEEKIFYQIAPNYKLILQEAKAYLKEENIFVIVDDLVNSKALAMITEGLAKEDVLISKSGKDVKEFLRVHQNQKGIVIGEALGIEVERNFNSNNLVVLTEYEEDSNLSPNTKRFTITNKYKAEIAVDIMEQIMSLTYNQEKGTCILLEPKIN